MGGVARFLKDVEERNKKEVKRLDVLHAIRREDLRPEEYEEVLALVQKVSIAMEIMFR